MNKIFSVLSLLLLSTSVFAWSIGPMNYQGRLLDGAGIPQTGTYNFTVNIYDALTNGTLKFSEQQNNIAVADGVYSFLVSTGITQTGTWDINLWNTPTLYLEIVVNGQTLTPRHLLAAAPFAFQANLALTTNNALALGGKSSGAVLQDICKTGKGKWLELANQGAGTCLGVASSFPGSAQVSISTLTASTDFSNLDLTNADVSGINFGSANFTGTLFKGTTMNGSGLNIANMTDTVWDAVIIMSPGLFTTSFYGARISNTNMTGWDLSVAFLDNSSIADLKACPSVLPSGYLCREQTMGSRKYMVIGPNMNFSETSIMQNRLDQYDLDLTTFQNTNISGASFRGNKLEKFWIGEGGTGGVADVSGCDFSKTTIRNSLIHGDLSGAIFDQSSIHNMVFDRLQSSDGVQFQSSELYSARFSPDAGSQVVNFESVVTSDVQFNTQVNGISIVQGSSFVLSFNNSSMANTRITASVTALTIFNTTISGGIYLGNQVSGTSMENAHFINGNISGNWRNVADNASDYINVSFYGADLTGATGMSPDEFIDVNWMGAICPDGHHVTLSTDTCIGHGI